MNKEELKIGMIVGTIIVMSVLINSIVEKKTNLDMTKEGLEQCKEYGPNNVFPNNTIWVKDCVKYYKSINNK